MSWALVLPVIIPFATAGLALWFRKDFDSQGRLCVIGAIVHLAACVYLLSQVCGHGIISVQIGNWPAPFGITFAADHLSAVLVAVTGFMGLAVTAYSRSEIKTNLLASGYQPLVFILTGGGVRGFFNRRSF